MSRAGWLSAGALFLAACSIDLPQQPLKAGVLPSCDKDNALSGGQCVPLSRLVGGQTAVADAGPSAVSAEDALFARTATRGVNVQRVVNETAIEIGRGSGTTSGQLNVYDGGVRANGHVLYAELAGYQNAQPTTLNLRLGGGVPSATPVLLARSGGATGAITIPNAGYLRARVHATLIASPALADGGTPTIDPTEFINCTVQVSIQTTTGNISRTATLSLPMSIPENAELAQGYTEKIIKVSAGDVVSAVTAGLFPPGIPFATCGLGDPQGQSNLVNPLTIDLELVETSDPVDAPAAPLP